ncbi:MAG: hypothetical protein HYU86_08315 [Chloroflexi bacterium]|nr:hypothetical protein [Chloroflexota bacterium]
MERIGEVIAATTVEIQGESYQLHNPPPLGSLVKTGGIYGVVHYAATESLDPGRPAIARGGEEREEADIFLHHPQLASLFRTTFRALAVGHSIDGKIYHFLPPRPAHVHSFVYLCSSEEVAAFTGSLDFLSLLLSASVPVAREELVAACLRQAATAQPSASAFLLQAGRELATRLGEDWASLSSILKRLRE